MSTIRPTFTGGERTNSLRVRLQEPGGQTPVLAGLPACSAGPTMNLPASWGILVGVLLYFNLSPLSLCLCYIVEILLNVPGFNTVHSSG